MAEFQIREYALRMARKEVLALVADGRLSWEDLHARLEPGEISVLHEMPPSVNWYPVATYDRLLRTLTDVEGGGSNDYLVERGKKAVESLTATGLELRQVVAIVRSQNQPVAQALGEEEARVLRQRIEKHGARAEVRTQEIGG